MWIELGLVLCAALAHCGMLCAALAAYCGMCDGLKSVLYWLTLDAVDA